MLDFDNFKKKLMVATKESFLKLSNISDLYAFSLYSDEYCQTISPVANTMSHLQQTRDEYEDPKNMVCKFSPDEWDFNILSHEPKFLELTNLLAQEDKENKKTDEEYIIYQNKFHSVCFDILLQLKEENFFKRNFDKDIFLIFSVSEFEFTTDKLASMVTQLNSNTYAEEYLKWMKTWGN